ncbi:MAG: thioredoxin family protein [Alphaproteobacteria bacterium]
MKIIAPMLLLATLLFPLSAHAEEMQPGDDGLYHPSWFLNSFLDLRDDHAEATKEGKNLAIIWEQKGCSYCKRMHTEYFSDQKLVGWISAHFVIVQLDLHGSRVVTDFDGEALQESEYARKHGIRLTPTIQFFRKDLKNKQKDQEREAARMPGLLEPNDFIGMFHYVSDTDGQGQNYRSYMKNWRP